METPAQRSGSRAWLLSVFTSNLALGAAWRLIPLYVLELGGGAFELGVVAAGSSWAILALFAGFSVAVGPTWVLLTASANVLVHRLTTDSRRGRRRDELDDGAGCIRCLAR